MKYSCKCSIKTETGNLFMSISFLEISYNFALISWYIYFSEHPITIINLRTIELNEYLIELRAVTENFSVVAN